MSVDRRKFLKGIGLSSLALSCPATLGALSTEKLKGSHAFVPSICEMCSTRCAIQARVDDNGKVFITGNPYSKGTGTAKGGALFSIAKELELPILYVGVGEQMEDLLEFDASEYIQNLVNSIFE